jgi:hypothetical protein
VENIVDHGTIGPRKFFGWQKEKREGRKRGRKKRRKRIERKINCTNKYFVSENRRKLLIKDFRLSLSITN